MRLVYFPINMAWAFMFGDSPTSMDGQIFYQTRGEAVSAASRVGLDVSRRGIVSVRQDARSFA